MGTVKLINPNERLVLEQGETKFFYRRVTSEEANAIRRSCTVRGEIDGGKAGMIILKKFLIGWENLQDWDDNQVPFSIENISMVPDQVLANIITAISEAEGIQAKTVSKAVDAASIDKTAKNS